MARRVLVGADTSLKEIEKETTPGHDGDLKTQWLTLRFDIAIVTSESAGGGGVAKAMKGGKRANSALNEKRNKQFGVSTQDGGASTRGPTDHGGLTERTCFPRWKSTWSIGTARNAA